MSSKSFPVCLSTKPDFDSNKDAGKMKLILANMESDEKSSFQEIEKKSKNLLQEKAQSKRRAIFEKKMQLQRPSGWLESFLSCLFNLTSNIVM